MGVNMERIEPLSEAQARNYNPLSLAFIGDSVYENYVRHHLVLKFPDMLPKFLHVEAVKYVKASSQSRIMELALPHLSHEEIYIFKRGRNTKSHSVAKNASVIDYRRASGFEALVGYLYLIGNEERLEELMKLSFQIIEGGEMNDQERE